MTDTAYFFVPAARRGLARSIKTAPSGTDQRVVAPVSLALEATRIDGSVLDPAPALEIPRVELYGPGDILGFDERIIIRRDPLPNVGDFEPNFFPMVEFAEADFPWRFTPDVATDRGLTPWITLIVLSETDGEFLEGQRGAPELPRSIRVDRAKLPDLAEAWRWAHVMVTGEAIAPTNAQVLLTQTDPDPDRMLSRVLCPRHLIPKTRYHVFIVPTFELGRLAGLGAPLDGVTSALAKSWTPVGPSNSAAPAGQPPVAEMIELPYYARWEFATAARGDFEYLVRELEPRYLTGLGRRPMACPPNAYFDPGVQRNDAALPHTLDLEGALASLDFQPTTWGMDPPPLSPSASPSAVGQEAGRANLAKLLNTAQVDALTWNDVQALVNVVHASRQQIAGETTGGPDPVVGPPMYGRWHAAQRFVSTSSQSWCDVINLDPRHRAAAGFGSLVVQRLQEDLMASAWKQLGAIEQVNETLRAAQLGREGSLALHRRLGKLPQGHFLRIAAPVASHVRLLASTGVRLDATALSGVVSNELPTAAFDPALRRISRMRGPVRKRQFRTTPTALAEFRQQTDFVQRLSEGKLAAVAPRRPAVALFGIGDITTAAFGANRLFAPSLPPLRSATTIGAIDPLAPRTVTPIGGGTLGTPTITSIPTLTDPTRPVPISTAPIDSTLTMTPPSGNPAFPGTPTPTSSFTAQPLTPVPSAPAPTAFAPVTIRFSEPDINSGVLTAAISRISTSFPAALQPWGTQLNPSLTAAREALDWLNLPRHERGVPPRGSLDDAVRSLTKALDPRVSIVNRVRTRVSGLPATRPDNLAPIMAAPEFPNPMYAPLAEISQDLVLPGIDTVPQNTLALLKINMRFVESYMVGCNHELAGELLWREYPADQRGSYFRQFFEVADSVGAPPVAGTEPAAVPEQFKDITRLHSWRSTRLGTHAVRKIDLVLLVRGDLLKKYPNTLVYAVPGVKVGLVRKPNLEGFVTAPATGPGKDPVFPVITGSLSPDVTFFGFILSQAQVKSSTTSEGYYFVLEERLSEPRFGIDEESDATGALQNWDDLAWTHFASVGPSRYLNGTAPSASAPASPAPQWNVSSASVASILLQEPVRVAVHADDMLPKKGS